ncbi:hypothetical protein [Paraburkholderia dilworthii]|uniref:hypothetical protein n=1 Tax=Paraburkholderia dilworthii TaxID=948106 RepID=UPI0004886C53|nr:hypothetical protein [Paraburkholderia dilworthii]
MLFRAVATAIVVCCASSAAMAGSYTEVWNPPEASAHLKPQTVKGHSARDVKGAPQAVKVAAKRAAHASQRSALASVAGRTEKSRTHGGVKHVAATGVNKPSDAAQSKARPKSAVAKEGKKPHAQIVNTKSGQAKIMNADTMQGHAAHPGSTNVTEKKKNAAANSAAVEPNLSALSANASADQMEAATNPATARSGALPPILH